MPKLAGIQAFVIEHWAFINNLNEIGWQGALPNLGNVKELLSRSVAECV